MDEPVVQGYTFSSFASPESSLGKRNGDVCQMVRRAREGDVHLQELLDLGPAFIVRFGDGHETVAFGVELNPWFPT